MKKNDKGPEMYIPAVKADSGGDEEGERNGGRRKRRREKVEKKIVMTPQFTMGNKVNYLGRWCLLLIF